MSDTMLLRKNTGTAETYTGYKVVADNSPELISFYSDKTKAINWFDLLENQYLMVAGADGEIEDMYKWKNGKHIRVFQKPIESTELGKIKPMNPQQALAIDALMDNDTTVKVLTGVSGSGKDFLMAACSFNLICTGYFEKLVWIRNNIEVRDTNPIGFLKGDFYEKMSVWAAPLADHVGGPEMLEDYVARGQIELQHLGHVRGRDIKRSIIYCSEAEHLTRKHVQLLLGRVGEGSILLLNGDWRQIDARAFEEDNGLRAAVDRLKGNRLFSYVNLPITVRSETAKLADLLD